MATKKGIRALRAILSTAAYSLSSLSLDMETMGSTSVQMSISCCDVQLSAAE